jgi:NADH-quinone oxidoreductase subunit H
VPTGADGLVFRLAPYLALVGAFLPWCVVPWSHHLVMLETPVAALFAIASSGIVVVALKMAGWGSGSKWSLLGGMRAVAQLVSYEVPIGLCVGGVVVWCGTLDLHAIVAHQYTPGVLSLLGWNALQSPFLLLLAVVFFTAGLAECQRSPFDMAEAESELVSGFNTEYSGLRWGMFAMAEYTEMLLIGALLATLFLGGYQSPFGEEWIVGLPVWLEVPLHVLVFGAKVVGTFLVMMWIRWTLPRFRVDQVMRLSWLGLVPLCLVALFGVALTLLAAGGTSSGAAYGRLPAAPHADLSWLGYLLGWGVPLLLGALVVRVAQQRHGRVHPALQKLTGGGT